MATERRECRKDLCREYAVVEVPDGPTMYATKAQVDVRCPKHGYRMERSERP